MDIKVLRNFVQIVESGSLTAASKKLFIAQPALTNQLKALEKETRTVLLERNSRHMRLTDTGRLFYERSKQIIALEDSMATEITDFESGNSGSLKIATITSAEVIMLQTIIPDFVAKFPNVKYEFYEKESDYVLHLLEDGTVDIGIIRTPCNITDGMDVFYISDERLVAAYNEKYFPELSKKKNEIFLNELCSCPILIIRRYVELFREACMLNVFDPNIRMVNQQIALSLKWAEYGLGVSIVPKTAIDSFSSGLSYKEFCGDGLATKCAIVTMKNRYKSKAVKTFLEICKEKL